MPVVLVPAERWGRWVDNFGQRHGGVTVSVVDGWLRGTGEDASQFEARLPFDREYAGPADPTAFAAAATPPQTWGVLLVRKGGFAVARLEGTTVVESKVGQRHVQGRSKAGGWSQQRFARRRDNQAREAFEAAADHAARILRPGPVVTGGDRTAVEEVLADPRLAALRVVPPWLTVPDPRRDVLERAVRDGLALRVDVVNADG